MADDHSQRLFRSNNAPAQGGQGRGQNPLSGNDPLAELARLIGQNDPFGEYGRAQAQPAPAPAVQPAQAAPATAPLQWDIDQSHAAYTQHDPMAEAQMAPPGYATPHGGPYDEGGHEAGYYAADPQAHEHYDPDDPHYAHDDQDYYDDVPRSRRRTGMLAIAGIFALAVVGTAGAFGYRAMFGSSGSHGVPPVIKADTTPSKIVPAGPAKDNSSKLITDRLNDRSQDERVVSREEKPVDVGQPGNGLTTGQVAPQPGAAPAPLGSGVIATEPKKVRTIAIHPDGTVEADATPPGAAPPEASQPLAAPPLAAMPESSPPAAEPPPQAANPPMQLADPQPAPEPEPPHQVAARPSPTRPAPVAQRRSAPAVSNAPLSLSPDAPAPRAPTRTAAVAPTQLAPVSRSVARTGGYAVQVSSQRSEAEAQAAFRGLQGKYPNQLGGHQVMIHRVDLGAKGVYYRALVGPFASGAEASQLCSSLRSAGGQCIVQKN